MRVRRLKTLILFGLFVGLLLGAGVAARNIILHQVRKKIEATLHYGKIRLRPIPPSIILEDVRTVTSSPFFAAEKVVLQISTRSIFRRDRPLKVFIDRPTIRLYAKPSREPRKPLTLDLRFPFAVEQGLVRNGEAFYWGEGLSVLARGVRAVFRQTSDAFLLRAECDGHEVLMDGLTGQITGKSRLVLEGRGERLTLRRLTVQGPDYLLKANGVFTNPKDPEFEIRGTVRGPVPLLADALDLPFRWKGTAEGAGRVTRQAGAVKVQASLESDDLVLNDIPLGRVAAGVSLGGGQIGRVDLQARKATGPAEYVDLTFAEGKVQGEARGVHLDPVIREVNIPWPVRSPAWGRFVLDQKTLRVEGEFRDDLLLEDPDRFPFQGPIALEWDGRQRVTFSSDRIETSFGGMSVNGDLVLGGNVGVFIRGDVTDVRRARNFVSLVLQAPLPIPEIRGSGTATVGILGPLSRPEVKIDFSLAPGGFDRYDVAAASGTVEVAPAGTTGFVRVDDPAFKSDIKLNIPRGSTEVDFTNAAGSVEWILSPLGLDLPLKGRASGRFEIRDAGRGLELGGDFASAALEVAGLRLQDVSGRLGYAAADNVLTLSNLGAEYNRGRVEGGFVLGLASREFSCDLEAREVDLSALAPKLQGQAGGTLKGKGYLDRDAAEGRFEIRGLRYAATPPSDASGTLRLALPEGRLEAQARGTIEPGRNDFELNLRYPEAERSWFLSASGTVSNPDRLIPWPEAKAGLRYLAEVRGGAGPVQLNGAVELSGTIFPIPGFAHALTDFSGLVTLQNDRATIRSFQGRLGGGDVFGAGEVTFGRGGLEAVDVRADGRDMVLSLFERTRGRADGSFRLTKSPAGFFLSGDVDVRSSYGGGRSRINSNSPPLPTPNPGGGRVFSTTWPSTFASGARTMSSSRIPSAGSRVGST